MGAYAEVVAVNADAAGAGVARRGRVNPLLLGNIDVVGVGWGGYAPGRPGYVAQQWAELEPHLRSGALDPLISETSGQQDACRALARIDERQVTGRVVPEV